MITLIASTNAGKDKLKVQARTLKIAVATLQEFRSHGMPFGVVTVSMGHEEEAGLVTAQQDEPDHMGEHPPFEFDDGPAG